MEYNHFRGKHMAFIEFNNVSKIYHISEVEIHALHDVSFTIDENEFVVIVGPSGAGKTTLLNLLGGMDFVSSGSIIVDKTNISRYNEKQLANFRRNDIGFVFQFYNLVGNLTTLENVELATQICKDALDPIDVLDKVGLSHRMDNFPSQLSGGEQQRVAIARALSKNPKLLLCDEPTGALDTETGQQILQLLQEAASLYNMTVVIITHNSVIAEMSQKVIHVHDGTIKKIEINERPKKASEIEW